VGGSLAAAGDVTGAGKSLQNHVHGGVRGGPDTTAPPN
jgi:phage baseplate assembly protein gpV